MSKLDDVVGGCVAQLWGRFKPAQGLQPAEIKSIAAQRKEFSAQLCAMLRGIDEPVDAITKAVNVVFADLMNQPFNVKLPTPEGVFDSIRGKLDRTAAVYRCPCCLKLGGSPNIHVDMNLLPARDGLVEVTLGSTTRTLCGVCHDALAWYTNRQMRFLEGQQFGYPPPTQLIPRDAWRPGMQPDEWADFTDGALMGDLALWVREFITDAADRAVLDQPRVLTHQ